MAKKKKQILRPIHYNQRWAAQSIHKMRRFISKEIYKPLMKVLDEPHKNASEGGRKGKSLEQMIRDRDAIYQGGYFQSNNFSPKAQQELQQMGAVYMRGKYFVEPNKLPLTLQMAIDNVRVENVATNRDLLNVFSDINGNITTGIANIDFGTDAEKNLKIVDGKIRRELNTIDLSEKKNVLDRLDQEYINDQTRPIPQLYDERTKQYFTKNLEAETTKMRKELSQMVLKGASRYELRRYVVKRMGVQYNRAKFVADQETRMIVGVAKAAHYQGYGINKYKWSPTRDEKLRERHKELSQAKTKYGIGIYSYDDPPPVVDEKTGRRAHVEQDYNCRCVARPVVEF